MAKPAYDQIWKSLTGTPGALLKRYHFVKVDANGDVITTAAAGDQAIGVAYEPNKVGEPAQVVVDGVAFITLGAALAAGTSVMAGADGRAVAYAVGTSPAFNKPMGILVVGGATNAIGSVLLA